MTALSPSGPARVGSASRVGRDLRLASGMVATLLRLDGTAPGMAWHRRRCAECRECRECREQYTRMKPSTLRKLFHP